MSKLTISTPTTHCPDRASAPDWTNVNYTYQIGTCSAGDWSYLVEKKSSEFDQAEVEIEIRRQFEAHKADCPHTKFQELYKQARTTTDKVAVIAKHLGLVET